MPTARTSAAIRGSKSRESRTGCIPRLGGERFCQVLKQKVNRFSECARKQPAFMTFIQLTSAEVRHFRRGQR